MDYLEGLNLSVDYIESNLDGEIDHERIARLAGMSASTYRRFFAAVSGMTVDEYIRKRKLQRAVSDITDTDAKLIDIAVRYGYSSAAAFSRAMRNYASESPREIREKGSSVSFPRLHFRIETGEGSMLMNGRTIVKMEEHRNEKVVCFRVDCSDPETAAWGLMSAWCRKYIPDRTARRYVGLAPEGHHPDGGRHRNASEHTRHEYVAMMYLVGSECGLEEFHGLKTEDAPQGLFLVNDVALNQYDENGLLDMAKSMIKASEAFTDFMQHTEGYEFDWEAGIFYEEHVFSEEWFRNGGFPDAFRMWVPVRQKTV